MKRGDKVAEALHQRRTGLGLTMRDIEARTQALALRDPEQFETVSRATVSNLENEGQDFFQRSRVLGRRRVRALVEVLYAGDMDRWMEDTGVGIITPVSDRLDLPAPRPLYVEGGPTTPAEVRSGNGALRLQVPELPWADLLLEVASRKNSPVVWPGQVIGVTLSATPAHRGLNLLSYRGKLALAWEVKTGQFAFLEGDGSFGLGPRDSVLGFVCWLRPQLPAAKKAG